MYMSDEEIKRSYRQAKDPKKQLRILADMNCCEVAVIEAIINGKPLVKQRTSPKKMTDTELMIQAFFEEMERIEKEISRLETRYINIKGVIDALSKLAEDEKRW